MLFISILSLITAKAVKIINISHIHFTRIVFIILLYAGALSFNVLYIQSIGSGIGLFNGYFQITQISQILEIFIFIIGGIILLSWPNIINKNITIKNINYGTDYSLIILFSILGSSLLISSIDLISIYLSIELQSFGLYVLSTLYRDSESSTSAGLKYFLLGGLSSCLILLGSGLIYSYTGLTNLESLYILNSSSDITSHQQYMLQGLSLGLIIIIIGFLIKIAAAPLHNWSPDVYDEVPTIVTTWLTIIPKISIFILLLELQINFNIIGGLNEILNNINNNIFLLLPIKIVFKNTIIKNILLISSLLSLIIGSILGLAQLKIKRLLAYSTISHIGFILLALAINTEQSIDSFLFYIIQYTITNLNIFFIILALSYSINKYSSSINNNELNIKDISYISEFKGIFNTNPLLSLSLGICLFSMAGIPPLIGFFSKQLVLYSALQNGYYFISIIAILVSVISASYYLQIIKNIYYIDNIENDKEDKIIHNQILISNTHSFIISLLTLFIILFFIKPSILLNSTQLLALSLFYI